MFDLQTIRLINNQKHELPAKSLNLTAKVKIIRAALRDCISLTEVTSLIPELSEALEVPISYEVLDRVQKVRLYSDTARGYFSTIISVKL